MAHKSSVMKTDFQNLDFKSDNSKPSVTTEA